MLRCGVFLFFFFKQKTAYERRISDGSSDVCSSDLARGPVRPGAATAAAAARRIGHLDPRADRRRRAVARAGAGGGGRLHPPPPSRPEWGRGSRAGRHPSPIIDRPPGPRAKPTSPKPPNASSPAFPIPPPPPHPLTQPPPPP